MPIDYTDPAILQLIANLQEDLNPPDMNYVGRQYFRPVMEIEHVGSAGGFDIFASALKLITSTANADTGTSAEALVIDGMGTLGNLIRVDNQHLTNRYAFILTSDGRLGLSTLSTNDVQSRLEVAQGDADVIGLILFAKASTGEDLLQVINDNGQRILWIDILGQLHWMDSQSTEFQFPGGQPVPDVNELIAWNFDPALSGGTAPLVEQSVYLQKFYCPRPSTLSSVMFNVTNAVAIGGSASYVGLYSTSGTKLAETADVNTSFESTGMKSVDFSTPYVADTGYYYIAILVGNNPGLGPDLSTTGAATEMNNANLAAATYRWAIGPTGQTTLPSSITMSSNTSAAGVTPWVGVK